MTKKSTTRTKQSNSNDVYVQGNPEATGEYVGAVEATYRNKKLEWYMYKQVEITLNVGLIRLLACLAG